MPQVRLRGVRQLHSTEEAGEQRQLASRGVCGGKGTVGERRSVATRPNTAPGSQGRADCWAYEKRHTGFLFRRAA
jgi:hypothetical protein